MFLDNKHMDRINGSGFSVEEKRDKERVRIWKKDGSLAV